MLTTMGRPHVADRTDPPPGGLSRVARSTIMLLTVAGLALSACGAPPDAPGQGLPGPGVVSAALYVPDGVRCLRVKGRGLNETVERDFDLVAGDRPEITIRGLPEGRVEITASAFDSKCTNATGDPSHVTASPVLIENFPGAIIDIDLVLQPNSGVGATVTFRSPAVEIACGADFTLARLADGSLLSWGANGFGQQGRGEHAGFAPGLIPGLSDVVQITAGPGHACALLSSGEVRCWGESLVGQTGTGFDFRVWTPTPVAGLNAVSQISAGGFTDNEAHTCVVERDTYRVLCFGSNEFGKLGQPYPDVRETAQPMLVPIYRFESVRASSDHTCGVTTDRQTVCWGANHVGQLGNPEADSSGRFHFPTVMRFKTMALATGTASFAQCGMLAGGTWHCWGRSEYGSFGNGIVDYDANGLPIPTVYQTPVRVSEWTGATQVAATHRRTCARFEDGSVRCAGDNLLGQLGSRFENAFYPRPSAVEGITNATQVCTSNGHSCALTREGRVFCWGANSAGQLGDGTKISSPVPVEVPLAAPPPPQKVSTDAFSDPTLITFEELSAGTAVTDQYAADGVTFGVEKSTPTIRDVGDADLSAGSTISPTQVLYNVPLERQSSAPALVMNFATPKRRVGFYMGGGSPDFKINVGAVVTARDQAGATIFVVTYVDVDVNVTRLFVGIDAGQATIASLEVQYDELEFPVTIDNLMFE